MNWGSTAGKSALVKMLMMEHGVSKRKSEKAVNAVFDCMARALRRGDEVELPIGWIHTAPRAGQEAETQIPEVQEYPDGKDILEARPLR
jgi:nucleoid DNA-binding protein